MEGWVVAAFLLGLITGVLLAVSGQAQVDKNKQAKDNARKEGTK